jgi:hypothetical protein
MKIRSEEVSFSVSSWRSLLLIKDEQIILNFYF